MHKRNKKKQDKKIIGKKVLNKNYFADGRLLTCYTEITPICEHTTSKIIPIKKKYFANSFDFSISYACAAGPPKLRGMAGASVSLICP